MVGRKWRTSFQASSLYKELVFEALDIVAQQRDPEESILIPIEVSSTQRSVLAGAVETQLRAHLWGRPATAATMRLGCQIP